MGSTTPVFVDMGIGFVARSGRNLTVRRVSKQPRCWMSSDCEQPDVYRGGHHILHTFLALFQSYYHLPTPLSNTLC